jgi:alkanesulfonate monooxygenase SsuD/methylene tetrahydromethanopterin reductase-like flavin-dependent oxidoreductase (luciferase family)
MLPLSVLDLSPVVAGSSGASSLRNSLDLAKFADLLGYTRYWVAEHHNLPSVAARRRRS